MAGIRLHVLNPNTTVAMTGTIAAAARRVAGPETEIIARTSREGPPTIEGWHDGAMAVPGLLTEIDRAEAEGVDAHVIACFDDTGIDAARSAARAPVVGIGEAACLAALQVAERFVIVTSAPVSVPVLKANVSRAGLHGRCAGVRAAGLGVAELETDAGEGEVAAAVRRAAAELPEAAIVLGCAGMADFAAELSAELARPVVDPVSAGIVLAEGMARLGLATVKTGGWALPRRQP
jgi:allantoin racemase